MSFFNNYLSNFVSNVVGNNEEDDLSNSENEGDTTTSLSDTTNLNPSTSFQHSNESQSKPRRVNRDEPIFDGFSHIAIHNIVDSDNATTNSDDTAKDDKIQQLQQQLQNLQNQYNNLEMLNKDNEEELEIIKAENDELKQKVASNEMVISQKDKQLENLNMGMSSLNAEIQKLVEENNQNYDLIISGAPDAMQEIMKEMQDKISKVFFHCLYHILAYPRESRE